MDSSPPPPDLLFPEPRELRRRAVGDVEAEQEADVDVDRELEMEAEADAEARREAAQEDVNGIGEPPDFSRESMYVTLFDEMITTVLDAEAYLFTAREVWILRYILSLPYAPHYLLTRLLLRRPRVFPIVTLVDAYSGEIGEEGVRRAAKVLAAELDVPEDIVQEEGEAAVEQEPPVTVNGNDTPCSPPTKSRPWADIPTGLTEAEERADPDLAEALRRSAWAEESGADVEEYLRVCECEAGPSRMPRGDAGESGAETCASGLAATSDTNGPPHIDTKFSLAPRPSPPITRLAHDEDNLTLDDIMSCMPADELRRVARGRKIPQNLLATRESTISALRDVARRQTTLDFGSTYSGKGKGKAKETPSCRTTSEALVAAQLLPLVGGHVLRLDRELCTLVARVNLVFSRTPPVSTGQSSLLLPPILVTAKKRHYPAYGVPQRSRIWPTRADMLTWERAVSWEVLVSEALGDIWGQIRAGGAPSVFAPRGQPMPRTECAKIVRGVWEATWPIWKEMVATEAPPPTGVVGDRFRTEHVLTRVVYKGAEALGVLHEYDLECEVLRALLTQRRWRRGKRGAWYERLALVLMTHYRGIPTAEERTAKLEEATQVCIDGLLDDDTHIIYRPGLSRRLTRLENKLNLPPDERHISFAELLTCETRELVAPRSSQNIGQMKRRDSGREGGDGDSQSQVQQVGKSAWIGRDGEVTVEGWVLEWWEDRGYHGFHAESSILTTLFALLMWPVLFHPLPGAFETAYQTAPLDLGEDGFSRARHDLIEARLAEMEDTPAALAMLRDADKRERPRGTWAVGLSWDFGATELAEILECMGGHAAASICRMLAEEYRHRASGVPDLIVWDYAKREARFVEVKGPGDTLSETQKIWIDVLLQAGVPVEVCRVKDKDEEARDKRSTAGKKGKTGQANGAGPRGKAKAPRESSSRSGSASSGLGTKRKQRNVAPRPSLDLGLSSAEAIVVDDSSDGEDAKRPRR